MSWRGHTLQKWSWRDILSGSGAGEATLSRSGAGEATLSGSEAGEATLSRSGAGEATLSGSQHNTAQDRHSHGTLRAKGRLRNTWHREVEAEVTKAACRWK